MKHLQKTAILASVVVVGLLLCTTTIQADQWDKKTVLTTNEPIRIPKVLLTPGTYVFKLVGSASDRHIVRVMNADETRVITTILAIPNYRLQPTGKSAFGFWEMPAGSPPALRSWFYPGDSFGQEFAYPKDTAAMVTATTLTPQPVVPVDPEETKTTVETPAEADRAEPAAAVPAPPAASQAPAPVPAPAPAPVAESTAPTNGNDPEPVAPKMLPETASNSPLLGMVGLMSMGMALAVRTLRLP